MIEKHIIIEAFPYILEKGKSKRVRSLLYEIGGQKDNEDVTISKVRYNPYSLQSELNIAKDFGFKMSRTRNKLLYSISLIFITLLVPQIVQSANGMGDAAALGKIGYIIIIVGISIGLLMLFLLIKFQLSWFIPILICSILGFAYSSWFHLGSFAFITFYVWKIYQKKSVSSLVTILNEGEKSDVVSEVEHLAFSLTLPFEAFLQMDVPRQALSKGGQVTVYNINVESIDPTHGVLANCNSGQDDFSIPVIFLIPVDKTSENSVLIKSYTQNRMNK